MADIQQPLAQFLTLEESAEVDKALLSSRDKLLTRVAIYSLKSLRQIALETGLAIDAITPEQVIAWVEQDESIQWQLEDESFEQFFTQLVLSSLKPLKQVAQEAGVAIANLTTSQVITWFEKNAKARVEGSDATFSE